MAGTGKPTREDRLKAALKINMARRKAQKRGRAAEEDRRAGNDPTEQDDQENTDNG